MEKGLEREGKKIGKLDKSKANKKKNINLRIGEE
jgi:hypothetical protein